MRSNNYLLISLLCITSMWITSCFSPGNSSENNTQSANNNSTKDLTIDTGDSKIKFKNKVLTISDISKQDHCFFGIAGTVISDHAETGGGKLKNIYTGTTTSYPIYYKCKITSRIIPIPKSDKPEDPILDLDYFDVVRTTYTLFPLSYRKISSDHADQLVKVEFNEGLSTYVYTITPPKHYQTSHTEGSGDDDEIQPFTAIQGTYFYTPRKDNPSKPLHEYPPLGTQFVKDNTRGVPGTKISFNYGRLGKVVDAGLPPFERFTDFEIGNLPEDTNNHYATDGVAPITFNVDNIKGIYAGSEYDLDDIDKQNLNISFKVEFDQDTTPMCQPDAVVKTIHDSINPGHYSLQFDLLKMHENGCFESNTTLNNYQIVASINGIRYIYPFSLFETEKFKITDVSLVDFTNTELTELHIPEAGAYKYYINQIKVTTDFFGENGLQSYIVPITPAMIGVWTYGGFRLDKVSLSVKDSRVKVGQDQSGYYLQVPDKPGDFDTTLTVNTTWTDLETKLPVTLSSNDHPITVYADYGQLAFDDVRFEYYNYKKDLVDLRDLDDKKGPLYIWESGNPVFVKVTGVLFDHKDSTRIDITGLIDPINWSLNDHDSIGNCLGTDKHPNPESWQAVTTLSWSNKDNAMVQAGIGSGQDCVRTAIEKDDVATIVYLMNSEHGIPEYFKSFSLTDLSGNQSFLHHSQLKDSKQAKLNFELAFKVGDPIRGESTALCKGTKLSDCDGVNLYFNKVNNYLGGQPLSEQYFAHAGDYYLFLKDQHGNSSPIQATNFRADYNKEYEMAGPYDTLGYAPIYVTLDSTKRDYYDGYLCDNADQSDYRNQKNYTNCYSSYRVEYDGFYDSQSNHSHSGATRNVPGILDFPHPLLYSGAQQNQENTAYKMNTDGTLTTDASNCYSLYRGEMFRGQGYRPKFYYTNPTGSNFSVKRSVNQYNYLNQDRFDEYLVNFTGNYGFYDDVGWLASSTYDDVSKNFYNCSNFVGYGNQTGLANTIYFGDSHFGIHISPTKQEVIIALPADSSNFFGRGDAFGGVGTLPPDKSLDITYVIGLYRQGNDIFCRDADKKGPYQKGTCIVANAKVQASYNGGAVYIRMQKNP